MAIANTFTFGGVSTTTYSVIVEGSGDYSGAKRAVEMVSIPGRNGAFALDKGYFENEPVEYKVLIQGATQATFETAVSAFKNAILSKTGYQRLTDTYHPDEYRMAVYSGGFDEEPTFHGKGASFKVKFDCKPQRWLLSGEAAVSADDGDILLNPTLFDASPMLEVEGHGTIEFNGYEIELNNETLGTVDLFNSKKYNIGTMSTASLASLVFNADLLNSGDKIEISSKLMNGILGSLLSYSVFGIDTPYVYLEKNLSTLPTSETNLVFRSIDLPGKQYSGGVGYSPTCRIMIQSAPATFYKGTSATYSASYTHDIKVGDSNHAEAYTVTLSVVIDISYDGDDAISVSITRTVANDSLGVCGLVDSSSIPSLNVQFGAGVGESTLSLLGNPTYIDCDLGECYKFEGGEPVSLNHKIDLGSELPTLASGSNTITYDNTITDLKIVPRWWNL